MSWEPIATAPRDGTTILCYSPGNKASMYTDARTPHWCADHVSSEYSAFYKMWPEAPYTHWMPLTAPQAASISSPEAVEAEEARRFEEHAKGEAK